MGSGISKNQRQERKERNKSLLENRSIEASIAIDAKRRKLVMKILCLGISNTGKSTIVKHMRLIHSDWFSKEEKASHKMAMLYTFYNAVYELLANLTLDCFECWGFKRFIETRVRGAVQGLDNEEHLNDTVSFFKTSAGIQAMSSLQKSNPCRNYIEYFIDRLQQVNNVFVDIQLTADDILRVRLPTTGVTYTTFDYNNSQFSMIDVGGQRSERKKWIHLFDDVKAVFFVVDISNFCTLHESLDLFTEICQTKSLQHASIILFFNKMDILNEMDDMHRISEYFPDYQDTGSAIEASQFIRQTFEGACDNMKSEIYSFFTCATDKRNIQMTFGSCSDIILKKNIANAGLH
eukprot:gene16801-18497_t